VEEDDAAAGVWRLKTLGRLDVDGEPFGIALDPQGRGVVTTRRGRAAMYAWYPDATWSDAAAVLTFEKHTSVPFTLAAGFFATLVDEPPSLIVASLEQAPSGAPTLSQKTSLSLGEGRPFQVLATPQSLWVFKRHAGPNNVAVLDLEVSQISSRLTLPGTPISIARVPGGSSLIALSRGVGDDARGTITVIDTEGRTQRPHAVEGTPHQVAFPAESAWAYVTRQGRQDLLIIDRTLGTVEGLLAIGVEPLTLTTGMAPHTLWVFATDGRLIHLKLSADGRRIEERVEARWPPGSVLLKAWTKDTALIADRRTRQLHVVSTATLDKLASLPLPGAVGQFVVDRSRARVYVTLPELGQVMVVDVAAP